MKVVVADQLVVTQVGASICTSCVQRLVVDGAVFPIAALEDGFFPVEDVLNVEGGTGQITLGDVYMVVVRLCFVIVDPRNARMVAIILFVTGSRERVWERPLDRGKLGTGHYVLLLIRLDRAVP